MLVVLSAPFSLRSRMSRVHCDAQCSALWDMEYEDIPSSE